MAFPVYEAGDEVMEELKTMLSDSSDIPASAGSEAQWAGLWRVSYAPHILTLGSLSLTKFDVYYDIAPAVDGEPPEIRSFVRFQGPFWKGWLNAAGRISNLPENEVEVAFKDFWIVSCYKVQYLF